MTVASPILIKRANEEDVSLILTFIRELAEYEQLLDNVSANETRVWAALFGDEPYAEAILAYQQEVPIAFPLYFFNYSSFSRLPNLYLEDIFVRPSSRGSGVGRQLFSYLAQEAIKCGCGRMEWAVLNWNEPAIRFYRDLAAEPVEGWTVFHLSRENMEQLASET